MTDSSIASVSDRTAGICVPARVLEAVGKEIPGRGCWEGARSSHRAAHLADSQGFDCSKVSSTAAVLGKVLLGSQRGEAARKQADRGERF